jgi:hypothetical protein
MRRSQHHLLRRESFYRLRTGRPKTINRRLHLRTGAPQTLRRRLHLSRHGTQWTDRATSPNVMSMPRVIAAPKARKRRR